MGSSFRKKRKRIDQQPTHTSTTLEGEPIEGMSHKVFDVKFLKLCDSMGITLDSSKSNDSAGKGALSAVSSTKSKGVGKLCTVGLNNQETMKEESISDGSLSSFVPEAKVSR